MSGVTGLDKALLGAAVLLVLFLMLCGDRVGRMRFWYEDRGRDLRKKYSRNRRSRAAVWCMAFRYGFLGMSEKGGRG